ncbi:hypothetical protein MMC25_005971 [Agyrium rufum]|nr:hypothetical protein [Agyrium rufum]
MATRRIPLSNNPNAANSPLHGQGTTKRPRSESVLGIENIHGQPPAKKQALTFEEATLQTPSKKARLDADGRVFNATINNVKKPATATRLTSFDKKLLAAAQKEKEVQAKPITKAEQVQEQSLENVRTWQRHYRKAFPEFVFFFDSIPEGIRIQASRNAGVLGARDERFFSKDVTHIVTTRSIPIDSTIKSSTEGTNPSSVSTISQDNVQPRTINPSLLEKNADRVVPKTKFTFEVPNIRKNDDVRKEPVKNTDVLVRAKEMGIKVWGIEKFERIISLLIEDGEPGQPSRHEHNLRGKINSAPVATKQGRQADLSTLLKNEKLHGASDRDPVKDRVMFKGPYIFVHDMNEKYKPIMVREYPKVENKDDGAWPHFRSVSSGKCPFVEESANSRRENERFERERERQKELERQRLAMLKARDQDAPRTRAVSAMESAEMKPPHMLQNGRVPLSTLPQGTTGQPRCAEEAEEVDPKEQVSYMSAPSAIRGLRHFPAGDGPGYFGGEPTASGLQQSNITSAIRSQMISSTAAAPGAKAGLSKEVHELKRKVLEKNSGPSLASLTSVRRPESQESVRSVAPPRVAKQKAQEKIGGTKLVNIQEEEDRPYSDEEEDTSDHVEKPVRRPSRSIAHARRDPKPGYCENCREKYDDFEEHTISRKHRKFALDSGNWKDLDRLLADLVRPLRTDVLEQSPSVRSASTLAQESR